VPLIGTTPCQPPLAVHSIASVAFQVKMEVAKLLIVVGKADKVTEGVASATMACADCATDPPAPVQVSVKLVVDVRGSVDTVPLVACVPLQPPEAVQLFAEVAFHFKVVEWPIATLLGFNSRVMAGTAEVESESLPELNEFWWQAARAVTSAHPIVPRTRCEIHGRLELLRSRTEVMRFP
jgi:hypothetical protein